MMKQKKENELFSSITHFVGFLLSIAGLTLLVVFSTRYGTVGHVVGFYIFGFGLILLYLASSIYHFISKAHKMKGIFQRIDHIMIYILIASTYTPLTLVLPERRWGWTLFGIIWGIAFIGIIIKIFQTNAKKWIAPTLYVVMGWIIVIVLPLLIKSLPLAGIWWLFFGGILYTIGVVFFVLARYIPRKRWFGIGMHEIFHLFVMGGSFSHFWFMFKYVLYLGGTINLEI